MDPNSLLFLSAMTLVIASPQDNADKAALNAYLKQSGIDKNLKRFERQHVPNEMRIVLGYAAYISKTLADQRIVIQWKF